MSESAASGDADPRPFSDDDTFAVIDDALTALAARRGLSLGEDHATMALLASLIDQAQRFLPEAVTNARLNGTGFATIAALVGTSADKARLRFDPDSPIADGRWPYIY